MLEVILDTETTGLSTLEKHRIVEIGCIELSNQIPTNKVFHEYINPQRNVSEDAYKIHGYSNKFLSDKKTFSEISRDFLNYELRLIKQKEIDKKDVVDTLEIARSKFPGAQNSLDALCKRFNIDSTRREKHSALVDCHLLKEVYVNLVDQKEPKLNLESSEIFDTNLSKGNIQKNNKERKLILPSANELEQHQKYLKSSLVKNYYK